MLVTMHRKDLSLGFAKISTKTRSLSVVVSVVLSVVVPSCKNDGPLDVIPPRCKNLGRDIAGRKSPVDARSIHVKSPGCKTP